MIIIVLCLACKKYPAEWIHSLLCNGCFHTLREQGDEEAIDSYMRQAKTIPATTFIGQA